ncbi:MAG: hypothetical protein U0787_13405 [Polyangia bacterium]
MSMPAPTSTNKRRTLRKLLEQILPTDGDFTAFCVDFFGETHRVFSDGMDRIQKTNLLLTRENEEAIEARLKQHDPERYEATLNSLAAVVDAKAERICIVHPLQRSQLFIGRTTEVTELQRWWADPGSRTRCRALCNFGGSGKTAIAERFVSWVQHNDPGAAIFGWSFYDDANTEAMLEKFHKWVEGVKEHHVLLVLDGLEKVQSPGAKDEARGTLTSKQLKKLLHSIAAQTKPYRALLTSRYPVKDLENYKPDAYIERRLDHLSEPDAIHLLRLLGVKSDEDTLRRVVQQCGGHALTLTVLGRYIAVYRNGIIDDDIDLTIDTTTDELPESIILNRCLTEHALCLSAEERNAISQIARNSPALREQYPAVSIVKFCDLGLLSIAANERFLIVHPALRDFFALIEGKNEEEIRSLSGRLRLELVEQPGSPHGECLFDDGPALIESVYCSECDRELNYAMEEPSFIERTENGALKVHFVDHRGNSSPLECPDCGNQDLDYQFHTYCSYHEHKMSKLLRDD